ncbi:hypothetical protein JBF11_05455 [Taurinivorans muris]|jgi:hypothetical protein|uniref:Flagellar protein FliT n=1 Tax=Taurinivorans muris TaxID=2787751 RepID=A0ABY5XYG8_9BACT|nr:hypothetical protein JBF11_05455 [Desulfovibrionaceae bacterium LT0009]
MMSSLTLLDRMLIIAQFELEAMQQGDVDGAISFFEERVALLDQLQVNQDENSEDCKMKLLALQGFHQIIYEEGLKLKEQIRQNLLESRVQRSASKRYANARGLNFYR